MSDAEQNSINPYQIGGDPLRSTDINQVYDHSYLQSLVASIGRWQRFMAVLGAIFSALMGLLVAITMIGNLMDGGVGAVAIVAVFGAMLLAFYLLPTVLLWKAATKARQFSVSSQSQDLVEFADSQLKFWRSIGMIVALVGGLYLLGMVIAFFGTVSFAAG